MSIKSLISNICGLLQRLFTGTLNLYAQLCEFSFKKKKKVFSISDSFKQPRELGELGKENLISFNLTLTEVFIVFSLGQELVGWDARPESQPQGQCFPPFLAPVSEHPAQLKDPAV